MVSPSHLRAVLDLRDLLVEEGWHPAVAGALVRRAAERTLPDSGLGKVWQTRRVRHELPGVPPRPVITGEQ